MQDKSILIESPNKAVLAGTCYTSTLVYGNLTETLLLGINKNRQLQTYLI